LRPGVTVHYWVNTWLDTEPIMLSEKKQYKVVVITGTTSTVQMALFGINQPMPITIVQKDKCVELPMDIPIGPGNYAIRILNEYQNLKNPYIVALFKKK
jgi:hypothetical protein